VTVKQWMIYGAYGYSGRLIAEHAREAGLSPILAGRDAQKCAALAGDLGFDSRCFGLDDPEAIVDALKDVDAVVHCAGPFSTTGQPMIDGCIAAGTHYFDITGEAFVFEHALSSSISNAATRADVIICPGVGFDVVPTDCIARSLSEAMPDAVALELGFAGSSRVSPGTAKTMVEGLGMGTWARRGGRLVRTGVLSRDIDFGDGPRLAMSISWGDISTAWHSTRIPDITVYIPVTRKMLTRARRAQWVRPFFRLGFVQSYLKSQVEQKVRGPDQAQRERDVTRIWGEVVDASGKRLAARLSTANGYTVTQLAPVAIIRHLMNNDAPSGSLTPSRLMGKDFASSLAGSTAIEFDAAG
jgi:short subunit dehydrogenase-like uncharacterized protein